MYVRGYSGTKKMNNQEISEECLAIFDEIMAIKEFLNWRGNNKIFEKTFIDYINDESIVDDRECKEGHERSAKTYTDEYTRKQEDKYKGKFKKLFQRVEKYKKSKESKLTNITLSQLRKLKKAVYSSEDYQKSGVSDGILDISTIIMLEKGSIEDEKYLRSLDYE